MVTVRVIVDYQLWSRDFYSRSKCVQKKCDRLGVEGVLFDSLSRAPKPGRISVSGCPRGGGVE